MLNLRAENGTSFLNSRNETNHFFVANQWFWEKKSTIIASTGNFVGQFQNSKGRNIYSVGRKRNFVGRFFEMSHKIARMSRRFFASKHKHPQNELISCDFIKKTAIFKGAENRVFPPSLLVAQIFVLNGGGKSRKVSLNEWKVATAMNEKKPHQQSICWCGYCVNNKCCVISFGA